MFFIYYPILFPNNPITNILLLPLFYEIEEPRQSKTKYYDLTRQGLKKETVVNILKELKGNTEKELKEIN